MFALLKIDSLGEVTILRINISKEVLIPLKEEYELDNEKKLDPYREVLKDCTDKKHWEEQMEKTRKEFCHKYLIKQIAFID